MQRVTCEMQAHIFSLPFLSSKIAFVHIEAYAPMLESGTASNAAIMLPKLATCMQSPNLARNHDSEQPWKLYSSKLKPIRNASSAVVR